jgi:hypothetical protein
MELLQQPHLDVNSLPDDQDEHDGPIHAAVDQEDGQLAMAALELLLACGLDTNLRKVTVLRSYCPNVSSHANSNFINRIKKNSNIFRESFDNDVFCVP